MIEGCMVVDIVIMDVHGMRMGGFEYQGTVMGMGMGELEDHGNEMIINVMDL
jgi:hypothetical protein